MTPPQAVLFDCDGVLVDSETITNRLLRDDLAERGLDLSLDEVLSIFVGGTIAGGAAQAARRGANIPSGWVDQFYEKMFAVLAQEVDAMPGVSDLLDQLIGAGIAIAVGSNGPVAKMEITLGRAGLLPRLVPHLYSSHDLPHPKPAPDVYLHAAAQLGVPPAHCVVIEDSVSGARAALTAGMTCIGYGATGSAPELTPYCDAIFSRMSDVAHHLGL